MDFFPFADPCIVDWLVGRMNANVLEVEDLVIGRSAITLSFACATGSLTRIIGHNGSGKTMIGRRIAGLVKDGDGQIKVAGQGVSDLSDLEMATRVALVPTDASLLFSRIGKTLRQEMELVFAFLGRGVKKSELKNTLERFALIDLADRDPFSFSGGEKVRAAIAIAVLKRPAVLILDDVFDQLDPNTEKEIHRELDEIRLETGMAILELRSRGPRHIIADDSNWIFLGHDNVLSGSLDDIWRNVADENPDLLPPMLSLTSFLMAHIPSLEFSSPPHSAVELAETIEKIGSFSNNGRRLSDKKQQNHLELSNLSFSYKEKDLFYLGPISVSFSRGRTAVLVGKNGAGKTTMLRCLANLEKGWTGDISFEKGGPKPSLPLHKWAAHVLYSFQNPDDQLFLPTVKEELLETARRTGKDMDEAKKRMDTLVERFALARRLEESPLNLSYPLRRIVTILSSFIAAPPVLLLDEPTAVLDLKNTRLLIETIIEYRASGGIMLLITHDYEFLSEIADDIVFLEDGKLVSKVSHEVGFEIWPITEAPILFQLVSKFGLGNTIWSRGELIKHFVAKTKPQNSVGGGAPVS